MGRYLTIFDEIVREATTGICGSNYLPLLFNTKEMRYTKFLNVGIVQKHYPYLFEPTFTILDNKKFEASLKEYLDAAVVFYDNDKKMKNDREPLKYLLYNTFSHMLLNEFDDARSTFLRQLDFIKNERLSDFYIPTNMGYIESLYGNLVIGVSKCDADSTTPYCIQISIERQINNKLYYYDLPCIKYGISKSTGYIMGIEKVGKRILGDDLNNDNEYKNELESYQSSIKKIIKKMIKTNEVNAEKLISLTCAISLLNERGIKKIIYPTILINIYNSFEISCYQNLAKLNSIYEEATNKNEIAILEETIAKISSLQKTLDNHPTILEQKNTNIIKHFRFLEEVFSDYKIYDYPMQKDTNMHFHIIQNGNKCTSWLLKEFDDVINKHENIEKRIKDL